MPSIRRAVAVLHAPSTACQDGRSAAVAFALALAASTLGGCASSPATSTATPASSPASASAPAGGGFFSRLWSSADERQKYLDNRQPWEVVAVRNIGQCGTAGDEPGAEHFDTRADVAAWETARGIRLLPPEGPGVAPPPYVVIEQGQKRSGGYGLLVSRQGFVWKNVLYISVTPVTPPADAVVAQALTAPCALVSVPPGEYRRIVILNAEGRLYAETALHTNGRAEGTSTVDGPAAVAPAENPAPPPAVPAAGPVEPPAPAEGPGMLPPEAPTGGPSVVPPT